jgi:hypothetical protein
MGYNAPDQAALEQARDKATRESPFTTLANGIEEHKDYWANNGGSPNPDSFFPGFEAGWHAAVEALSNGQDLPDAENQGKGEEEWEWKHGFKAGARDAQHAGSN